MNPALFLSVLGGLTSETRTLVDAMTVKPTSSRMKRIDRVIRSLKSSGVWDKLDVFYMLAAHDEQAGRLNWKNPGTFTLTATEIPVFTADRGFKGDGVGARLTSAFNASTFGGQYALDSAMLGVYVHSPGTIGNALDMTMVGSLISYNAGATGFNVRVNDATSLALAGNTAAHRAGRRNTSTGQELWLNGTLAAGPDAVVSTSVATGFSLLASAAGATPSDARLSFAYCGGAPTDDQMASMHAALLTYLQGVGAA